MNQKQQIKTLSKGMKMKVALAMALSHHAGLLIMDEPTSGLDPLVRRQLLDVLIEFMKKDDRRSVFFSTHITSDLDRVADELILIDKGQIIFQQDKDTLLEEHKTVKGDTRYLNDKNRKLFTAVQITEFGFKGLTKQVDEVKDTIKDLIIEKPSIEDIMLGYIEKSC